MTGFVLVRCHDIRKQERCSEAIPYSFFFSNAYLSLMTFAKLAPVTSKNFSIGTPAPGAPPVCGGAGAPDMQRTGDACSNACERRGADAAPATDAAPAAGCRANAAYRGTRAAAPPARSTLAPARITCRFAEAMRISRTQNAERFLGRAQGETSFWKLAASGGADPICGGL